MGLDNSVLAYVGCLLRIKPVEAWGWSTGDIPQPFEMRVLRFYNEQRELCGGVGRVTTRNSRFSEEYVIFSPRHVGRYNFTDQPDWGYNIIICANDPFGHENRWPLPDALGLRAVGYGEVTPAVVG
jgi:hypothetical protein